MHIAVCGGAILCSVFFIAEVFSFAGSFAVPKQLMEEATTLEVPVVGAGGNVFFEREGFHYGDIVISRRVYRVRLWESPKGKDSLTIYEHSSLSFPIRNGVWVIEVPKSKDFGGVYQAVHGKSIGKTVLLLGLFGLGTFVLSYLAIRGYCLIKGKPMRKRRRRRRS